MKMGFDHCVVSADWAKNPPQISTLHTKSIKLKGLQLDYCILIIVTIYLWVRSEV